MDDDEITSWALAARSGERAAAAQFIRGTREPVRRLLRQLADAQHVEDLVQETYLRAFDALPRYARRSPARLWLFAIARRVAADHVRTARRRPRSSPVEVTDAADRRRSTPASAEYVELQLAIGALDPERREAFVLTRVLGLSYAEVAEICDCPVGTIRSRVYRARGDLVAMLATADGSAGAAGN